MREIPIRKMKSSLSSWRRGDILVSLKHSDEISIYFSFFIGAMEEFNYLLWVECEAFSYKPPEFLMPLPVRGLWTSSSEPFNPLASLRSILRLWIFHSARVAATQNCALEFITISSLRVQFATQTLIFIETRLSEAFSGSRNLCLLSIFLIVS